MTAPSYDSQVFFRRPRDECLSRMSRHAKKLRDHDINPCLAETDATTKCMSDNNYNKDMCTDYFLKYKNCRKFWHGIMMQRKRNGVKPEMPSAEERKKILESMGKPYWLEIWIDWLLSLYIWRLGSSKLPSYELDFTVAICWIKIRS